MTESFEFIKALHRVGSPTISISGDWKSSYESVERYWRMLDGLNYDAIFVESRQPNAKEMLEAWESTDWDSCGLTLKSLFERAKDVWHGLKDTLGKFALGHGNEMYGNGKWDFEQWRDFRLVCDNTLYLWEKRLNELCRVYGYPSLKIENPTSRTERPDHIKEMFVLSPYMDEFFDAPKTAAKWGQMATRFIRQGKMKPFSKGDKAQLWAQIVEDFPDLEEMKSGYDVFRQETPPVEKK